MRIEDSYDSMFGSEKLKEVDYIMPTTLPMSINEKKIEREMEKAKKEKKWVLAFVIGTKPCFYKFYGSIVEAHKADLPYLIINSNQHYDNVLTYGLKEFDFERNVAANLSIRGDLVQKSSELMIKISWIARYLKKKWPDVTVVPVVLGDTILTSMVPAAWMFSRNERAIQNEAGLRSMTPTAIRDVEKLDVETFIDKQFHGEWELLRNEPFPEQWDTFTSAAGSEFLFAPLDINKQHLLREGHPEKNIWVTGGVVVDALELKMKEKPEKSIFELYPQLENDKWIRVDIHRRGNLTYSRFKAVLGAMKLMVDKGYNVNFIEMNATRNALDAYKFREEIEKLSKNKNFLFTQVWPEYAHAIEFFKSNHCFCAFTDSGGVQEEMNILNKICLTCRFNTDRPETVNDAKSNLIVPPVNDKIVYNMVKQVYNDEYLQKQMINSKNLYGEKVGGKFIKIVKELMEKNEKPFKWAHEALGFSSGDEKNTDYL